MGQHFHNNAEVNFCSRISARSDIRLNGKLHGSCDELFPVGATACMCDFDQRFNEQSGSDCVIFIKTHRHDGISSDSSIEKYFIAYGDPTCYCKELIENLGVFMVPGMKRKGVIRY